MQIKSEELCRNCYYGERNPGCKGVSCLECKMDKVGEDGFYGCACNSIECGQHCPYFIYHISQKNTRRTNL